MRPRSITRTGYRKRSPVDLFVVFAPFFEVGCTFFLRDQILHMRRGRFPLPCRMAIREGKKARPTRRPMVATKKGGQSPTRVISPCAIVSRAVKKGDLPPVRLFIVATTTPHPERMHKVPAPGDCSLCWTEGLATRTQEARDRFAFYISVFSRPALASRCLVTPLSPWAGIATRVHGR